MLTRKTLFPVPNAFCPFLLSSFHKMKAGSFFQATINRETQMRSRFVAVLFAMSILCSCEKTSQDASRVIASYTCPITSGYFFAVIDTNGKNLLSSSADSRSGFSI
jgi:hypothetical protein